MLYDGYDDEFSRTGSFRYRRQEPEKTLLYQLVEPHWPAFQALLEAHGKRLPGYPLREFEDYLKCGRVNHVKCCPVNRSQVRPAVILAVDSIE